MLYTAKELVDQVRLMYVGMTRAKSQLLISASGDTVFTQRLVDLVAPCTTNHKDKNYFGEIRVRAELIIFCSDPDSKNTR